MWSKRQLIFLYDVIWFTLTAFGGAQAHVGMMLKNFVNKRKYISETELLELNALTQILPGPSSTQTLVGIAYKVGGLTMAISAFFIWILPSAALMTLAVLSYTLLGQKQKFAAILEFVQPIAVGIVAYAAFSFGRTILKSTTSIWLAAGSLFATLLIRNAYAFPILILIGGIVSSTVETAIEENNLRFKLFSNINPRKIAYFLGVLLLFAALGALINRTSPFSLPIRLFENFYRNGIMIFGGGQVLIPFMLILILFIVPFWNDLKKITRIKNSLSGINAVSVGFMGAAFLFLLQPVGVNFFSIGLIIMTFLLLVFTKIKTPILILAGVLLGLFV